MTQKRYKKNLKRKSKKPKLSKFEIKQENIRNSIINDALVNLRTSLLNNQNRSTQASRMIEQSRRINSQNSTDV
jgi:ABC-type uncharacterized transport system auxiliary subunit